MSTVWFYFLTYIYIRYDMKIYSIHIFCFMCTLESTVEPRQKARSSAGGWDDGHREFHAVRMAVTAVWTEVTVSRL